MRAALRRSPVLVVIGALSCVVLAGQVSASGSPQASGGSVSSAAGERGTDTAHASRKGCSKPKGYTRCVRVRSTVGAYKTDDGSLVAEVVFRSADKGCLAKVKLLFAPSYQFLEDISFPDLPEEGLEFFRVPEITYLLPKTGKGIYRAVVPADTSLRATYVRRVGPDVVHVQKTVTIKQALSVLVGYRHSALRNSGWRSRSQADTWCAPLRAYRASEITL
jgi:hypothetical protein